MSSISALGGGQWAATQMPRLSEARQKLFERVDADGSGSVDATELQGSLDKLAEKTGRSAPDATALVQQSDADGDGSLSAKELGTAARSLLPSTMEFAQHRSEKIFSKLDADGNGSLNADELNTVVDPLIRRAAGDGAVDASAQSQTEAAVFGSIDSDGDGSITQAEFSALMTPPRETATPGSPSSPPDLTAPPQSPPDLTAPPASPPDLVASPKSPPDLTAPPQSPPDAVPGTGGHAGRSQHAFQMPALNDLVSNQYTQIAAGTGGTTAGGVSVDV